MVAIPKTREQVAPGNGRLDLEATDVTGQHFARIAGFPGDATVRDLVRELVDRMGLRRANEAGVPYAYAARIERDGRNLLETEIVGDALQTGDRLTLAPNVDAG